MVSSFNHYELLEFRNFNPDMRVGPLVRCMPLGYAEFAAKLNAFSVNSYFEYLNREFIDDAHRRGMKVFVYTVDEPGDIERMKSLGVDGIFSNFPDRL